MHASSDDIAMCWDQPVGVRVNQKYRQHKWVFMVCKIVIVALIFNIAVSFLALAQTNLRNPTSDPVWYEKSCAGFPIQGYPFSRCNISDVFYRGQNTWNGFIYQRLDAYVERPDGSLLSVQHMRSANQGFANSKFPRGVTGQQALFKCKIPKVYHGLKMGELAAYCDQKGIVGRRLMSQCPSKNILIPLNPL